MAPDHKTIANFTRDNGPAIQAARRQFVVLCRDLQLFAIETVAVDGSKFKAVNNRDRNYTVAKVAKSLEQVKASIARYLAAIDRADREGNDVPEARTQRISEKIATLRRQMAFLREMQTQVETADDEQVSLTDPDARLMATSGHVTGIVGYNVQIAVDPEHHLVVTHEVVIEGNDRTQLVPKGRPLQWGRFSGRSPRDVRLPTWHRSATAFGLSVDAQSLSLAWPALLKIHIWRFYDVIFF